MKLLAVWGILVVGIVCGSWVFLNDDFRFTNDEFLVGSRQWISSLEVNLANIKQIILNEQREQEREKKIIDCIEKYNPIMKGELKEQIATTILEMTWRYANLGLDTILAVITWESAKTWRPSIVSNAGAIGLMQVMPETGCFLAKQEGLLNFSVRDLFDALINIRLGCRYLSHLIQLYGSLEVALAAYNGGAKNARLFAEKNRDKCHPETWGYVPNVMALVRQ